MFTYESEDATELEFVEGDGIDVVDDTDAGWWLGICAGRIGYFPSNYVNSEA